MKLVFNIIINAVLYKQKVINFVFKAYFCALLTKKKHLIIFFYVRKRKYIRHSASLSL